MKEKIKLENKTKQLINDVDKLENKLYSDPDCIKDLLEVVVEQFDEVTNDYEILANGIEIKRSKSFELPEEYKNMEVQTKEMQGFERKLTAEGDTND